MSDISLIEQLKRKLNIGRPEVGYELNDALMALSAAAPQQPPAARGPAGEPVEAQPVEQEPNADAQKPTSFKNTDQTKQRDLVTTQNYLDPGQFSEDFTPAVMRSPQIAAQIQGINQMDDMNAQWLKAQSGRENIAPTLGFLDSLSGGNSLATYERPLNKADLITKLTEKMAISQKAKNELVDNITNILNASKQGQNQTLIEALTTKMTGSGFDRPQVNNPMEKVWSVFEKSSKKYVDQLAAGETAVVLVNQGSTIADQMLKRSLIKMSGDDRPSNSDVDAFGGDSRLLNKAQQWYDSKFDTGTFSDMNQKDIRRLIYGMNEYAKKRMRNYALSHGRTASKFQPSLANMSPQEISQALYERAVAEQMPTAIEELKTGKAASGVSAKPKASTGRSAGFKPKSDDELNKMTGPQLEAYFKSLSRK